MGSVGCPVDYGEENNTENSDAEHDLGNLRLPPIVYELALLIGLRVYWCESLEPVVELADEGA